jgi:hypothetical protein
MVDTQTKDALAAKKRFVESLTRSQQFLTDENFLQPDSTNERPPKKKKQKSTDAPNSRHESKSSSTRYY